MILENIPRIKAHFNFRFISRCVSSYNFYTNVDLIMAYKRITPIYCIDQNLCVLKCYVNEFSISFRQKCK